MSTQLEADLSEFLRVIAESLDISESRYQKAEERYQAVGKWLGRNGSIFASANPEIYPQGSFRLGTVIKPVSDSEDYDIDLVCQVTLRKDQITQRQLKQAVGQEIKDYVEANNMDSQPEESKRCWKLNYADGAQFHMDILPAIPDWVYFKFLLESKGYTNIWADWAIAITDNTLPNHNRLDTDWPRSNPRGYAAWFKEKMKTQFQAQQRSLAESLRASIEDIPEYKIKTPLQRSIQILKRHRDLMFVKDPDNKPISIIITTLAAHAYRNERDLLEALINIVDNMPGYIQKIDGVSWVANPVNPFENFADKWQKHPRQEMSFQLWLQQVRSDLKSALQLRDISAISESFRSKLGDRIVSQATKRLSGKGDVKTLAVLSGIGGLPSRFNVPHREAPLWPIAAQYTLSLSGQYKYNGQWHHFDANGRRLPKRCDLLFSAITDTPPPYTVYWQVVNTGEEARQTHDLRGEIFPSATAGVGGRTQKERTAYTGDHWIECFIVKNGVCVARSGEFVVKIE